MHILHLTTFLQGGAGRMIVSLAAAHRQAGHQVTVVTDAGGEPGYASYQEYREALIAAGVRVCTVHSTFKRDLALNARAAAALRVLVDPHSVDVAHTHAAIPTMVARLALGSSGVPIVQTMHGWGIAKTREQVETDISLLGLTDIVITPSRAARDTLLRLGLRPDLVHVVPYGIDGEIPEVAVDTVDAGRLAALKADNRRIAICVGTLGERKNQRLLVEALTHPATANVNVVLIGDGDASGLEAHARQLGVAERLHVLGHRANASRYLSLADVFVLPSRNEGLPIAILEAIRAGLPIVASAIPELVEVVTEDDLGAVFEPAHAEALAQTIARVLDGACHSDQRTHRRRVFERRYLRERMIDSCMRLYEAAISRRAAAPV